MSHFATTDCNIFIMHCDKGTPERNSPLLCSQVDYAFMHGYLPYPDELLNHISQHSAAVIRE